MFYCRTAYFPVFNFKDLYFFLFYRLRLHFFFLGRTSWSIRRFIFKRNRFISRASINHLAHNRGWRQKLQNELLFRSFSRCVALEIPLGVSGSCVVFAVREENPACGNEPRWEDDRRKNEEREETFSIFPPTRRGQEVRRKERRRTAQRGRKRSVIPARRYFVTSSPSHPIPRRTTVRISELARQQCFSLVSLTVLLLQRRCSALAMAEPGLTYALVSASR